MTEYNGGNVKADHLCVLVHGLWGQPKHLASVAASLRGAYSEDQLHILVAESNSGYFTYDGIETGGERVCLEIEQALAAVDARGGHITKLSVVGYSLGGLVARYAVGLLHAKGVLDKLECKNFVAFASPFLGVRSPSRGVFSTLFNTLGARTLSMSGRQLFGIDSFRDTGRPLLTILADPESIFMAGLRRFRRRTLYANIVNDRTAVHYTTAIAKTDPYSAVAAAGGEVEDLPINFVPGYADVVLDPHKPVTLALLPQAMQGVRDRKTRRTKHEAKGRPSAARALGNFLARPWSREARVALLEAAPMLALALLLPLGVTLFLLNAVYQNAKSSRRRQLHEGGLAGIDIKNYRVPLWIQGLRDTIEDAYDEVNIAQDPDYVAAKGPGSDSGSGSGSDSEPDSIAQGETQADSSRRQEQHQRALSQSSLSLSQQQLQAESRETRQSHQHHSHTEHAQPVLALSPEQFVMIDNLDSLGWRKYPVWIHKVGHSHAAIVVRHDSPRFEEGKTVLRHFVNEEFVL